MASLGVVSLLHGKALTEALRLFRWFDVEYPTARPRQPAFPHITLSDGECAHPEDLGEAIVKLCARLSPFEIVIDGLGSFETPHVVYLRVLPTKGLRAAQRKVYDAMVPRCGRVEREYGPDIWVPHVTLALKHLEHSDPKVVLERMQGVHPHHQWTVGSLWLVQLEEATGQILTVRECPLLGKANPTG